MRKKLYKFDTPVATTSGFTINDFYDYDDYEQFRNLVKASGIKGIRNVNGYAVFASALPIDELLRRFHTVAPITLLEAS